MKEAAMEAYLTVLTDHIDNYPLLFQPYPVNRKWLSAFSKRKGLQHINPHAFRHTAASILVTQGIDIVTVSKMLGHARVSTTEDIYSHVIEASKELASNELANVYYRNEVVNE